MSVTIKVERVRRFRPAPPCIPLLARPKYLFNFKVNKSWIAFRLAVINPFRAWYKHRILKRHQKLKDGMRPFYEVREYKGKEYPLDVSGLPKWERPQWRR